MKKLQRCFLCAVLVVLSIAAPVSADDPPATEEQTVFRPIVSPQPANAAAKGLVKVKVFPLYDKLVRGERCLVALKLSVKDGWHVNANPADPEFTIPTKITLKSKHKVKLKDVKFPKHKLHTMQSETEPYHVYDGDFYVYLLLAPDAAESAAEAQLQFHVHYQACNDTTCIKPATLVVGGSLPLANPGDAIRKINADKFPDPRTGRLPTPRQ